MTNSSTRPLVTIAIPTYNRASLFLRDAIEAALRQTYPALEVVISDNCSSDDTPALVREFHDPRIRYFRQERNIGANNNFNFCLQQARGDYFLLFLDDDQIDSDFVQTCMDAAGDRTDVGIIRTGTRMIDSSGKAVFERPNRSAGLSFVELLRAWFRNETTFFLCSTLINTEGLRAVGGFHSKHNLFQDVGAELKVAARLGRVDIEEAKAGFRSHGENMGSAARIQDWCEDSLELLDILCGLAPESEELIRHEGKPFFCRMNYYLINNNVAKSLVSMPGRIKMYFTVARRFDYAESPYTYIWQNELRPKLRSVKSRLLRQT